MKINLKSVKIRYLEDLEIFGNQIVHFPVGLGRCHKGNQKSLNTMMKIQQSRIGESEPN